MLLLGPPGCGKSDIALQLLEYGFVLVADDRVDIEGRTARAPNALSGLLEVRGLGLMRLAHAAQAELALAVTLDPQADRLPRPAWHPDLGVPLVALDPRGASAALRVRLALDCALGLVEQSVGAFRE